MCNLCAWSRSEVDVLELRLPLGITGMKHQSACDQTVSIGRHARHQLIENLAHRRVSHLESQRLLPGISLDERQRQIGSRREIGDDGCQPGLLHGKMINAADQKLFAARSQPLAMARTL